MYGSIYISLEKTEEITCIPLQSPSFSVEKYMELSEFTETEKPYFHFIIDWLSSIFKSISEYLTCQELPFRLAPNKIYDTLTHTSRIYPLPI